MKNIHYFYCGLFLVLFSLNLCGQEIDVVQMSFIISTANGRSQTVFLGAAEQATTGIDAALGEAEIPPLPPAEIFDARIISTPGKSQLGMGTYYDYRPIGSKTSQFIETYMIAYQGGVNITSVKIEWAIPFPSRVTKVTIDGVDMNGKTEISTQFGTGQASVQITYNYRPFTLTVNPVSLTFSASNRGQLPTKTIEITPDGDLSAAWIMNTDAEWLDIFPASGSGKKTVEASINNQALPAGNYSGVIHVSSLQYPEQVDIPVSLTMTVGVDNEIESPNSIKLFQNYPNPIALAQHGNSLARISFDLGDRYFSDGQPTLKIFDLFSREIADLSDQIARQSGVQNISFNARNIGSGMYCYRLTVGGMQISRMMIIMK